MTRATAHAMNQPHGDLQRWLNPGWRDVMVAWWEGYDLDGLHRAAKAARDARPGLRRLGPAADSPGSPGAAPTVETAPLDANEAAVRALEARDLDRASQPVWTLERAKSAQLLWGDDQTGPGDAQFMVDAVRPFGLGPANSVLDLSAGLGGAGRAIATTFDTWVTGLESSPVLARMAMDRAKALGMAKKAPVAHYDPERFNQAGSFDLILGDRVLHRVRDKAAFLDQACDCVKPKGGLLLFDYVIEGTPTSWDAWNSWRDAEPHEVYPWTGSRMADELVQRNMDLRVAQDITQAHRNQILARIRRLGDVLQSTILEGPMIAAMMRELSLWWARLRVLGAGLRLYRFSALKAA